MNAQSITNLAYESINEKYSKAKYGDFDVIMDITNGYINASKLCIDGGKHMKAWLRNDNNKELIKSFEEIIKGSAQICADLMIVINTGINELRGTYVHLLLIPHIASWVSPLFAYKVSKIVNEFLVREKDDEIRRLTGDNLDLKKMFQDAEMRRNEENKQRDEENKKRDEENKLMLQKMIHQNQEMKEQNEKTHQKLDDTQKTLEVTHAKLDKSDNANEELQNTLEVVVTQLENVADEIVKPSKRVDVHEQFVVMKLNDDKSEHSFKVFCSQNKNAVRAKNLVLREHPDATVFLEITPSPNSKNFLHNLKDAYGTGKDVKIKIYYNYITLVNGTSDNDICDMVSTVVENAKKIVTASSI